MSLYEGELTPPTAIITVQTFDREWERNKTKVGINKFLGSGPPPPSI